jgi:hypothetical protein
VTNPRGVRELSWILVGDATYAGFVIGLPEDWYQ